MEELNKKYHTNMHVFISTYNSRHIMSLDKNHFLLCQRTMEIIKLQVSALYLSLLSTSSSVSFLCHNPDKIIFKSYYNEIIIIKLHL